MGNHCTRTPSCRKMWSFISSNINSNKSQARTLSGPDHIEELYSYFTTEQAWWKLCNPEAEKLFKAIKKAVHVGDDHRNDVWGARDAGCDAWLWGSEVTSFKVVKLISLVSSNLRRV